jgi:hypothetical protein
MWTRPGRCQARRLRGDRSEGYCEQLAVSRKLGVQPRRQASLRHELDPEPVLCGHAGGNRLGLDAASSGLHRTHASIQDPAVSGCVTANSPKWPGRHKRLDQGRGNTTPRARDRSFCLCSTRYNIVTPCTPVRLHARGKDINRGEIGDTRQSRPRGSSFTVLLSAAGDTVLLLARDLRRFGHVRASAL